MDDLQLKTISIFCPFYMEKTQHVENNDSKFVQYTSASAAMSIIRNKEVWLRNTKCMNDYYEVEHGLECLITAFHSEDDGDRFKSILEKIFPGIIKEFTDLFDGWIPIFKDSTYILCVSEHLQEEELYGRLSMWRAYGGSRSVALVLNNKPFMTPTDVFQAHAYPVLYQDLNKFNEEFRNLTNRINDEQEFIKKLGKQQVINNLFNVFKTFVLCSKHPGFKEEREWRVVYNPVFKSSKYVKSNIEIIDETPQEVYKIPLKNIPEGNFYGATIPEFIDKIIIGPNDQQIILGKAFSKLLEEAGCKNPMDKIRYSGIPLR